MIASLPMYNHPRLDDANGRYWALLRASLGAAGIATPETLSHSDDRYTIWQNPGLVFSQTCGMPYRNSLRGQVTIIGTPDFGVEDCRPGYYCSVLVVRKDNPRTKVAEYRDATFAFNSEDSQSGYAAPHAYTKSLGFWFDKRVQTGGHLASAKSVADGHADMAALDTVSWHIFQEYEDCAKNLRVIYTTSETPGLPYISAAGSNRERIFDAVANAIQQLATDDREALGLKGIVYIPEDDYLAVPNP